MPACTDLEEKGTIHPEMQYPHIQNDYNTKYSATNLLNITVMCCRSQLTYKLNARRGSIHSLKNSRNDCFPPDDGKKRMCRSADVGKRRMWMQRTSAFYLSYSATPLDQ